MRKGKLLIILTLLLTCCSIGEKTANKSFYYDSLTRKHVYAFVEQMPNYKGGDFEFGNDFFKVFHYDYREDERIQTSFLVSFVITKEGRLIGARINKEDGDNTEVEKTVLKSVEQLQNWEAGKHNNKPVNVIKTVRLNIDFQMRH